MTDSEYKKLNDLNFSLRQINQIDILMQYGFLLDDILKYIDYKINTNYLRVVSSGMKNKGLNDSDKTCILKCLSANVNPDFFFIEGFDANKKDTMILIINDILKYGAFHKYNRYDFLDLVKNAKSADGYFYVAYQCSIIDRLNPFDIIREDFNERELRYSTKLCTYGYFELVDNIKKMNRLYETKMDNIFKLRELKINVVDAINSYNDENLDDMIYYKYKKIDVNPYLLNKPYANNVNLCVKLMGAGLSDNDIEKCLENTKYIKSKYRTCDDLLWDKFIKKVLSGEDMSKIKDIYHLDENNNLER